MSKLLTKRYTRKEPPFLVIAGEHSGDLLGADIVDALKRMGHDSFFGTGGPQMKSAGVELIETVDTMAVFGFTGALLAYRRLKALATRLADMAKERNTKIAVLIDYPGFNLKIAEMLKERGIRVVFVVSPQLWAWHYSRIESIKKNVDLMLVLFPFEKEMYDKEGIPCEVIGHPLVNRLPKQLRQEEYISIRRNSIALLPGSRFSEVSKLLPSMLKAAKIIQAAIPDARFLLPCADGKLEEYIRVNASELGVPKLEILKKGSLRAMEASDLVILASGTATLEAAFFEKPMVILYKVSWINLLIASIVMRVRNVGMVNLLSRNRVALELLQSEVTPENIAEEALRILKNPPVRRGIQEELAEVKRHLGSGNPTVKAARHISDLALNVRRR